MWILSFLGISQKIIVGINKYKKMKQGSMAISSQQTQPRPQWASRICGNWRRLRGKGGLPERSPSDGSSALVSLMCILLLYDQFRKITPSKTDTWNWEMGQCFSSEGKKKKGSFLKYQHYFMKRFHCLTTFHQENLKNEKCDVHVLVLRPHSYSISIAYSRFLQNHVCNLKHVSGYVFPIYQLFN